ncbi:MAG: MltA domain-containing protein, partial [Candidatus Nucleicultricaceae bacterium]
MSHATAEYLSGLDEDHQNQLERVTLFDSSEWQNYAWPEDVTEAFVHSAEYLLNGGLKAHFFQADECLWRKILETFLTHRPQGEKLRTFFEDHFIPVRRTELHHPFLFTGYFEPEYEASTELTETFSVPLYGRPSDLILIEDLGVINPKLAGHRVGGFVEDGTLKPYVTRKEIYEGALSSKNLEIAHVKDLREAYFLSIQGSGVLVYPDQSKKRVAYAGTNGRPYQSIGALLVERGLIAASEISMQSIWAWCEDHPESM